MTTDTQWYALRVQPQKEFIAAFLLRQRGAHTYVPTELRARRRNRYAKGTDEMAFPILPGCVFVGFDGQPEWYSIMGNPLIVGAIGYDGTPWRLDLVELLRWRARVPDGCLVLNEGVRLVQVEGRRGFYRSQYDRPHFIAARRKTPDERAEPVVNPTRQQVEWLSRFVLRQPEVLRAAA